MAQVSAGWLRRTVARALSEDVGAGDVTTAAIVPEGQRGRATVITRGDIVLAGAAAFDEVFLQVGAVEVDWRYADGDRVAAGETIAVLKGSLSAILTGERTALNFLMRLSGVATLAARYVKAVEGTRCRIVDTRKTTPGLRALEKAAVEAGGARNHRFGLFDGVLVKDNHIAAAGSLKLAVTRARAAAPHTLKIEVEVAKLNQLAEAIDAGADIVMLDNMTPEDARRAVEIAAGRVLLEASGGMTLEAVRAYAEAGVDLVSVGRLTHSAPAADLSLTVKKGGS